ncbi:Uncharacterised protein [Serratia proteamaculans]|uniref:hypothetical protein n=1 Tax=Serratia proteamaculans TaxID=28151 RepID=UPI00217C549A|nr:hypothetical protein [Serratia proteamaculans]CAI1578908.1 Uncharacterised protein [Serratia proteamaculans]
MLKRYTPDSSIHMSHEFSFMRETPEGGYVEYGDYATLFAELETVKAERDAQQKRADALAVERDAARNALASIYKTVTGERPEWSNWHAYLDDIVEEVDAALAAIEARGVEKLADKLDAEIEQIMRGAFFYDEISSREAISKMVREFSAELREAK